MHAIKELHSLNRIKMATQEVMNSCFNSSTAIAHGIYCITEVVLKLTFMTMIKILALIGLAVLYDKNQKLKK